MSDAVNLTDSCSYQLRLKVEKLESLGYKKFGCMEHIRTPITLGAAEGYDRHEYRQLMIKETY